MGLSPEAVLEALAAARGDALCVSTMTSAPAWRALTGDELSVKCAGFMGGASSLGLGLALARPERRVLVLDGDGSLLMQLGALATIAGAAPRNLTHLVFRNGVYHCSGAQPTPGGAAVDYVRMALGAGYRDAFAIREARELERRLPDLLGAPGPLLAELHTDLARKAPDEDYGASSFAVQAEQLREALLGGEPRA
jgi:phosphonopyruvate decarboxylase